MAAKGRFPKRERLPHFIYMTGWEHRPWVNFNLVTSVERLPKTYAKGEVHGYVVTFPSGVEKKVTNTFDVAQIAQLIGDELPEPN